MSDRVSFLHNCLFLDACCIINLAASGIQTEILDILPLQVWVADYVKGDEALWYYNGPDDAIETVKEHIDLDPLVEAGLLSIASIDSEEEAITFVTFAASLDDGEAMTGALAIHRGCVIATDERKGTNYFKRTAPGNQIVSTLELVKFWADQVQASHELLGSVLWSIRRKARYAPAAQHPLFNWWEKHFPAGEGGEL